MPIDNQTMSRDQWQRRIERAEELAGKYPFAGEILGFYLGIARFQKDLYNRLEDLTRKKNGAEAQADGPPELGLLVARFRPFLSVVEKSAPAALAQVARQLDAGSNDSHTQLLNAFWDGMGTTDAPAGPEQFFARAFLQPYAEFVRSRSDRCWDGYTLSLCPFCGRAPGVGVLRPLGDGGQRSLVCSFCQAEWEFRRIVCAGCGEEDHRKLPVYTAEEVAHVRVECCDTCKRYLKTVDMTKSGLAEPIVDEIAAVPLDLWAQERGYAKLQSNLVQL
jgi:formate dehydrogenase accessory protein FdhE